MGKVSKVRAFKVDKEISEEPFVARKISDFLGNGFAHTDIWLRRTQRTFEKNDAENRYDLEIIAGSIRVIGKVVNREIVPEKGAVLKKLPTDTGSPAAGENQEVGNFDIIFGDIFSSQSERQKKVLGVTTDKHAEENGIIYSPATKKEDHAYKAVACSFEVTQYRGRLNEKYII